MQTLETLRERSETLRAEKGRLTFYQGIGADVLPAHDHTDRYDSYHRDEPTTPMVEATADFVARLRGLLIELGEIAMCKGAPIESRAPAYEAALCLDERRMLAANRCSADIVYLEKKILKAEGTVLRIDNVGGSELVKVTPYPVNIEDPASMIELELTTNFDTAMDGWTLDKFSGIYVRMRDTPGYQLELESDDYMLIQNAHARTSEWLSPGGWNSTTPAGQWGLIYGIDDVCEWLERTRCVKREELERLALVPGFETVSNIS